MNQKERTTYEQLLEDHRLRFFSNSYWMQALMKMIVYK
jgi:hypothetical protein